MEPQTDQPQANPPAMPSSEVPQGTPSNQTSEPTESKKSFLNPKTLIIIIVVVILLVGLGLGVWLLGKKDKMAQRAPSATPAAQAEVQGVSLSLESPTDGAVMVNNTLVVKGKTAPKATVVYYTTKDQGSTESDEAGNFTGTLQAGSGINTLTVTAYADNGDEKSLTVDVVSDAQS